MPDHFADEARDLAVAFAHELNQPLGSVANLLRGMRRRVASGRIEPDELNEVLGRAIRLNAFAAEVVAGMREFVTARRPRRGPVDLEAVAADSLILLESEIRRQGVTVDGPCVQGRALIRGHRTMLQQVLVNLIRNAVEAMAEQSRAERRLRLGIDRQGAGWHVWISDSGRGLAEGQDPFTPFVTGKAGAIGVGLNISRSIVERHGGLLWYEPNPDGGMTFRMALPGDSCPEAES